MRFKVLVSILAAGGLLFIFGYTWRLGGSSQKPLNFIDTDLANFPLVDLDDEPEVLHAPFRTKGRDIVDSNGRRVKLASVNWYGASDEIF